MISGRVPDRRGGDLDVDQRPILRRRVLSISCRSRPSAFGKQVLELLPLGWHVAERAADHPPRSSRTCAPRRIPAGHPVVEVDLEDCDG